MTTTAKPSDQLVRDVDNGATSPIASNTGVSENSDARAYGVAAPGYRLPDATHLGSVSLQVADLERSLAYYQTVLGFRVIERSTTRATLGAHGDDTAIVILNERAGVNPVPRRGRLGLYHFAILLPDRASLGRFVWHLSEIGVYAGSSDHYVSEALYLTDPDGLGIEVYADRPRNMWRIDNRQLAMASEPLDLDDLIRSANNVPWSGMPKGTVIGHVHLYVSDIEHAAMFYHNGLGMDKIVWNYPGALFMSAGGYHHHLGTNTWASGAPVATDDDARLLEWNVHVNDVASAAQAAQSVQSLGYDVVQSGDAWIATDPWGTRVRIAV